MRFFHPIRKDLFEFHRDENRKSGNKYEEFVKTVHRGSSRTIIFL